MTNQQNAESSTYSGNRSRCCHCCCCCCRLQFFSVLLLAGLTLMKRTWWHRIVIFRCLLFFCYSKCKTSFISCWLIFCYWAFITRSFFIPLYLPLSASLYPSLTLCVSFCLHLRSIYSHYLYLWDGSKNKIKHVTLIKVRMFLRNDVRSNANRFSVLLL